MSREFVLCLGCWMEQEIEVVLDVDFLEDGCTGVQLEMVNIPFPGDEPSEMNPTMIKINNRLFRGKLVENVSPVLFVQSNETDVNPVCCTTAELDLENVTFMPKSG